MKLLATQKERRTAQLHQHDQELVSRRGVDVPVDSLEDGVLGVGDLLGGELVFGNVDHDPDGEESVGGLAHEFDGQVEGGHRQEQELFVGWSLLRRVLQQHAIHVVHHPRHGLSGEAEVVDH